MNNNAVLKVTRDNDATTSIELRLKPASQCVSLIVYEYISPTGDQYNETWRIDNLDLIGEYTIQLYDSWGKLILETSDYHNDWSTKVSGTYHYFIRYEGELRNQGILIVDQP